MTTVYDFDALQIDGTSVRLKKFKGKVMLIVNTASACGFTPQFTGLEELHQTYGRKGLVVLGFPCNQFGAQEPGDEKEIASFCAVSYGVTFPMFAKVEVNGESAHPLYKFLKKEKKGLAGTEAIKWNFTKFLVDADGKVVERFGPQDTPELIGRKLSKMI